ncbi:hypothetical protein Y032_0017g3381 [Ancylostoma ceylanicum]|uniref:Uncharacterized protein n=1 Tax=Ancylostoma ceylanicum TaxID=53326 RepID=A0A016V488_9BILA|nr:hypothetical protein Y032_0017g3381 [Ancylostoma ceylanicum]
MSALFNPVREATHIRIVPLLFLTTTIRAARWSDRLVRVHIRFPSGRSQHSQRPDEQMTLLMRKVLHGAPYGTEQHKHSP